MKKLVLFTFLFKAQLTFAGSLVVPYVIIGNDGLIPVNELGLNLQARYNQVVNAIGNISMGCTGTHIGQNIVMTAGHCFNATQRFMESQPCQDITVNWGNRGTQTANLVSRCLRVLGAQVTNGADYAFFLVDRAPRAFVQIEKTQAPYYGQPLTIFSHPESQPLRWSKNCILGRSMIPTFSPRHLFHTCDTKGGSSGAAILDAKTLKIIGIHNGFTGQNYNYATDIRFVPLAQILIRNRITILPPDNGSSGLPSFPQPTP
jgi:hypothetical protein